MPLWENDKERETEIIEEIFNQKIKLNNTIIYFSNVNPNIDLDIIIKK